MEGVGFSEVIRAQSSVSNNDKLCLNDPQQVFKTLYVEGLKT